MSDPLKNFNACDDFFITVINSYIITAAMEVLGMKNINEVPSSELLHKPEDIWMESVEQRRSILHKVCVAVVEK